MCVMVVVVVLKQEILGAMRPSVCCFPVEEFFSTADAMSQELWGPGGGLMHFDK
jgi:hypothetical protein